jgi:signal transduction histidine kinase
MDPPEVLEQVGRRGVTFGKSGGSGIGLYHAKRNVEAWGGSFRVTSENGRGVTIIVKCPVRFAGVHVARS